MYRQSEKNLLSSNISSTCPRNMVNFGPLAAENFSLVWCTPGNFNGFCILAALLYGVYYSGRQPNFAALNRGRHLHLAGRPSRWALAHILVCGSSYFLKLMLVFMMQRLSLHKVGHCIVANGKHSLIDMFRYSLREIRNTVLYNRSLTF